MRSEFLFPRVPVDDVDIPLQVFDTGVLLHREREPDRAADLTDDLRAEFLLVLLERVLQLLQARFAQRPVRRPVGFVEGPAGRADRAIGIGGGAVGDDADRLLGRRVDVVVRRAAARLDEFPVDQHPSLAVHLRHCALLDLGPTLPAHLTLTSGRFAAPAGAAGNLLAAMRLAALDLGSNSFHLLVADVHPDGTFESITREKEMLRLGDEVSRFGRITDRVAESAIATVSRFKRIADADGALEVIAKATSAIRSAENGSEVVDQLEAAAGVDIDVISGLEEARLIFAAIRASVLLDPSPALCIDIGGGSVEFMVGDSAALRWATSEHLGVGRLTAELVESDPPSKADRKRLEERIRSTLEPLEPDIAGFAPRMAVGSSGTLNDLARMVTAARTGELPATSNGLKIAQADFLDLHERIMRSKTSERRRMPGLEAQRAELLPAGSMLLAIAMDLFGFDELTASDWALREGIVLDAVRTHDPDDWSDDPRALRRAAVSGLARRCNSSPEHTRHVVKLALSLFDQTVELHHLGPKIARCSSTRSSCTTSASTCLARAITVTPPIWWRTPSSGAFPRPRSRSSPPSCAITAKATRRRRRSAWQPCPPTIASASGRSTRSCGSPTASTGAAGAPWNG